MGDHLSLLSADTNTNISLQGFHDERMSQRLSRGDPLLGIECQAAVKQIPEQFQLLNFYITEALRCRHEACSEIARRLAERKSLDGVLQWTHVS
jgi:hypothetical protein